MWFSDFAVRTATIAGKQQKAIKYMGRLFEMESRRLFEQRAKGKEVAQTVMLVPLDGFNFFEQACPSCTQSLNIGKEYRQMQLMKEH